MTPRQKAAAAVVGHVLGAMVDWTEGDLATFACAGVAADLLLDGDAPYADLLGAALTFGDAAPTHVDRAAEILDAHRATLRRLEYEISSSTDLVAIATILSGIGRA